MASLEPFVWASGFALSKSTFEHQFLKPVLIPHLVAYDLDWPPFIDENGALARWNVSGSLRSPLRAYSKRFGLTKVLPDWGTKGSVFADTVAVKVRDSPFLTQLRGPA